MLWKDVVVFEPSCQKFHRDLKRWQLWNMQIILLSLNNKVCAEKMQQIANKHCATFFLEDGKLELKNAGKELRNPRLGEGARRGRNARVEKKSLNNLLKRRKEWSDDEDMGIMIITLLSSDNKIFFLNSVDIVSCFYQKTDSPFISCHSLDSHLKYIIQEQKLFHWDSVEHFLDRKRCF